MSTRVALLGANPGIRLADVAFELELAHGLTASAADVTVRIEEPGPRRPVDVDDFDLGGVRHHLTAAFAPCEKARVEIAGEPVTGRLERAFLTDAETWTRTPTA